VVQVKQWFRSNSRSRYTIKPIRKDKAGRVISPIVTKPVYERKAIELQGFCSEHRARYTISRLESSVIDRQNFQQLSFNVGQTTLIKSMKRGALS
jgi:hypothetical protein